MAAGRPLRVGITCYPSVGGSGILASALGEELARRGHEVHFISYERPFRLPADAPRLHFHPVVINDYELFRYPDYTLPLSVKMAEVARAESLDVLHVHYAVPHATAAILARAMLPAGGPRVVTTLHGTDTTLLGRDPGYGPAIRHALMQSDAVTAVSAWLRDETVRLLAVERDPGLAARAAENAALQSLDLSGAAPLARTKQQASDAFAAAFTATTRTGMSTDQAVKASTAELTRRLQSLSAENRRLLEHAIALQSRVIETIAGAALPRAVAPGYGALGRARMLRQPPPLALSARA